MGSARAMNQTNLQSWSHFSYYPSANWSSNQGVACVERTFAQLQRTYCSLDDEIGMDDFRETGGWRLVS